MFDISNPQKREQFLIVVAGIALVIILIGILPAQFQMMSKLRIERNGLKDKITEHQQHTQNKAEIQSRLAAMKTQALALMDTPQGSQSMTRYQDWVIGMATNVGIRNITSTDPSRASSGRGATFSRHVFTITGEGRLNQIAEFLRQFYRTEYLHTIQRVQPSPMGNQPGMFRVVFRIEVLALPQVNQVNIPSNEQIIATDDEREMLMAISNRAILSEYTPPQPPRYEAPPPVPPEFKEVAYCFLDAIVEVDGKPQCWINNRPRGQRYFLFEGGVIPLSEGQCIIKKIDIDAQCIQFDAFGLLCTVRVGNNFDDLEMVVPESESEPEGVESEGVESEETESPEPEPEDMETEEEEEAEE